MVAVGCFTCFGLSSDVCRVERMYNGMYDAGVREAEYSEALTW